MPDRVIATTGRSTLASLAVAAVAVCLLPSCRGRVLRVENVPNHDRAFAFDRPPCEPGPAPRARAGELRLHYSGVSGVYLELDGVAVMGAPLFSRHPLASAAFGSYRTDRPAIDRWMRELPTDRVRGLLVGHGHYDHLGDVPYLLEHHLPLARLWVNESSSLMLASYRELTDRVHVVDGSVGEWIALTDTQDAPIPIRVMPVRSKHAAIFAGYHYASGRVNRPWERGFEGRRLRRFRSGRTFAFVIDFLAGDHRSTRFRVLYLDAAGIPEDLPRDRPFDLVVLCVPSFWQVEGYPGRLLASTGARYALLTHYEDFFRPLDKPIRFVPSLTNRRANRFVERVRTVMGRAETRVHEPRSCTCGPCGPGFSMPLPGEWLSFALDETAERAR